MRKGFTLIELLVVIAIIGILAALIAPSATKALSAANETKCKNNMRNLHAAVINYANANGGDLPFAGSYEVHWSDGYHGRPGWISWLPKDGKTVSWDPGSVADAKKNSQLSKVSDADFGGKNSKAAKEAMFAITNGTLWAYTDKEPGVYFCPVAVKTEGLLKGAKMTYVMNEFFYCQMHPNGNFDHRHLSRIGTPSESFTSNGVKYTPEASRLLLFAEHEADSSWSDKEYQIGKNCLLHITDNEDAENSSHLGTFHSGPSSKRDAAWGHVVFLDGHIDKVLPNFDPKRDKVDLSDIDGVKNRAYWYSIGEEPAPIVD